jgi:hypothetical protein
MHKYVVLENKRRLCKCSRAGQPNWTDRRTQPGLSLTNTSEVRNNKGRSCKSRPDCKEEIASKKRITIYLAVLRAPLGVLRRQRLLILAMDDHRLFASKAIAVYFQPESFSSGQLLVTVDPARAPRQIRFSVPADLATAFIQLRVPWPEGPPG